MHGCNDNPTVEQFAAAYRRLLVHNEVTASNYANCLETYENILTVSSRRPKLMENTESSSDRFVAVNDSGEDGELPPFESLVGNTNGIDHDNTLRLQLNVIAYLASFIEKEIIEGKQQRLAVKCTNCIRAFGENDLVCDEFLERKSHTEDIMIPCESTVIVCTKAEQELQRCEYSIEDYNRTIGKILAAIDFKNVFSASDFEHQEQDHKRLFISTIVRIYVRKKMNFIARTKTKEKVGVSLKSQLKKLIHFKGQ